MRVISKMGLLKKLEAASNVHKCFRETFSDYSQVKRLIQFLIENEGSLNLISKSCYIHQNGFQKYILYTSISRKWRIRLHAWNHKQTNEPDIHNHTFNFSSFILTGGLKNCIYKTNSAGGLEFKQLKYDINNTTSNSEIVPLDAVEFLEALEPVYLKKGDFYYQSANKIHKINPITFPTITLVLQESWIHKNSMIYRNVNSKYNVIHRIHQPVKKSRVQEDLNSICSLF